MTDVLLRFAHISDTHLTDDADYIKAYSDYTPLVGARALINALNELPVPLDFILHTGDVIYDPDPDAYAVARDLFAQLNAPVHYVAGNHDHLEAIQTHLMGVAEDDLQIFPHYEMDIHGVQVVVVDSNAPADLPAGMISADQLEWLDELCRDEMDMRPMVIGVHHNILPNGTPWLDDWMRAQNGEMFHAIIAQANERLRGVFHGHIHQHTITQRDGVLYCSAGSSWCQFYSVTMPHNERVTPDPLTRPSFNLVTLTASQTFIRPYYFDVHGGEL